MIRCVQHPHRGMVRTSMAMNIVQSLLHNAENGYLHMVIKFVLLAVNLQICVQYLPLPQLFGKLSKGRNQSQIIKGHWTHVKDNLTDIRQTGTNLTSQLLQICLSFIWTGIHQTLSHGSLIYEINHFLGRTIMYLTGNPKALIFLCLDNLHSQKLIFGYDFHLGYHITEL